MEIQKKRDSGKVTFYSPAVLLLIVSLIFLANFPTSGFNSKHQGQRNMLEMEEGIYLIVGAFSFFENAERYSDMLFLRGFSTKYGYHSKRGYYYVYIDVYSDINLALANYHTYRDTGQFPNAWLLTITPQGDTEFGKNKNSFTQNKIEKNFDNSKANLTSPDNYQGGINEKKTNRKATEHTALANDNANKHEVTISENSLQSVRPEEETDAAKQSMFFNVYDINNNKKLHAKILMIDHTKSSLMDELESNQSVNVSIPDNESKKAEFISNIFGYRKVQRSVSFKNLEFENNPVISQDSGRILIDFGLTRLRKGDIVTMYNVFFFNNSAIMKPESKFEVNQLLNILRENINYKIMIHGHTNGKGYGTIIKMDKDDTNFFEFSPNNKETYGSAKQLSKERAKVIHRYLLHQGIDKKRVDFKGWGGKKMIYPPIGPLGKQNARVEIEVLED